MANSIAPWINDPSQMSPSLNLGLSLLANSNTPGGFGSIFGKSALMAGQNSQQAQLVQQQIEQAKLAQQIAQQKMAFLGAPGGMSGGPQQAPPQGPPQAPQGAPPGQAPPWMPQGSPQAAGLAESRMGAPPQQSADQSQPNPWLSPPTKQDIDSTPIGGMSPDWLARYAVAIDNQNPLAAYQSVHKQQLELAQQQIAPKLASIDYLLKSDTPSKYMQADKQLVAAWPQLAAQAGLDPQKDFTDDGVRHALSFARNQLASSVGLPGVDPANRLITKTLPDGRVVQEDPITGKQTIEAASDLEKVLDPKTGQPILVPKGKAAGMTPFNPSIYGAANVTDQALQFAADTYRTTGKFPGSFGRSPALQAKVLNKIAADADANNDTVGAIAARQGALKANGQALDMNTKKLAVIEPATKKLELDITNLLAAADKAGGVQSPVVNRAIRAWQQGVRGDGAVAQMVIHLNAVEGEYAKLNSGGTGAAAPSVTVRKEAHDAINKYMSKGTLSDVAQAIRMDGQNALQVLQDEKTSLTDAMSQTAPGGGKTLTDPGQSTSTPKSGAYPPAIQALMDKHK